MNPLARDPMRRCIPVEQWPAGDRAAWQAAIRPGDPFEPGGLAANWRSRTRALVAQSYGQWLTCLQCHGTLDESQSPAERVTGAAVASYSQLLQRRCRSATVVMRIEGLIEALRVMEPEAEFAWLRRVLARLKHRGGDRRPKIDRMRPSADLYRLGLSLMAAADANPARRSIKTAALHRDGAIIALLAARPLRVSTFAALELGRHIVMRGDCYWLDLPGEITKTACPIEMPVPKELTPCLERYITDYRATLLGTKGIPHLWVTKDGTPMREHAIRARICKRTQLAFGRAITPHLFRDCAATSVAVEDPDHVRIAAILLGHRSLATTNKYYNQASGLEAGRRYQAQIRQRRGKPPIADLRPRHDQ